ncbi:MAG: hypothetical protein ACRBDL_11435 [Alphaproteobacteria bacterium]
MGKRHGRHGHHGDGQDVCTAAGAAAGSVIGGIIDEALGGNGQVGEVVGGVAGAVGGHKECDDGKDDHHGRGHGHRHRPAGKLHYHPGLDIEHRHIRGGTRHTHPHHHSSVDVDEQFDKSKGLPEETEEQIAAIASEMGADNPEVVAGQTAELDAANEANFKITA